MSRLGPHRKGRFRFRYRPATMGEKGAIAMITMQVTVDVKDDRQVVVTLPPEVPTGKTELIICVGAMPTERKKPRTSLTQWAEANGEHWGDKLSSEDVEGFTGRRF
jgi:hypothetical protein